MRTIQEMMQDYVLLLSVAVCAFALTGWTYQLIEAGIKRCNRRRIPAQLEEEDIGSV